MIIKCRIKQDKREEETNEDISGIFSISSLHMENDAVRAL